MEDPKAIKQRALAIGLPYRTWAKLASTPESRLHFPQISNWFGGIAPSAEKQARLIEVLEDVEDLVASAKVRPDLSEPENVKIALQTLAEIRAEAEGADAI